MGSYQLVSCHCVYSRMLSLYINTGIVYPLSLYPSTVFIANMAVSVLSFSNNDIHFPKSSFQYGPPSSWNHHYFDARGPPAAAYYKEPVLQPRKPVKPAAAQHRLSAPVIFSPPQRRLDPLPEEENNRSWQDDIRQMRETTLYMLDEIKQLAEQLIETEKQARKWRQESQETREALARLEKEYATLQYQLEQERSSSWKLLSSVLKKSKNTEK